MVRSVFLDPADELLWCRRPREDITRLGRRGCFPFDKQTMIRQHRFRAAGINGPKPQVFLGVFLTVSSMIGRLSAWTISMCSAPGPLRMILFSR